MRRIRSMSRVARAARATCFTAGRRGPLRPPFCRLRRPGRSRNRRPATCAAACQLCRCSAARPAKDVGAGQNGCAPRRPICLARRCTTRLTTHEVLLDARLPVRPPRGDWSRRRLLPLGGGWLLAAPGDGGPQWSLAAVGMLLVQDADNAPVVEVTLAGGDTVMIGGQSAVTWKQAICTALVRGGAGAARSGATSKILTLLVTEHGLALGAEVPGVWTRNRLGRLLRHLLPRLPLRAPAARSGRRLRASARALTLLCEQTLP
uniref:FGGY_N domain-containing protein n=1 Tax=Macrostomum lignano TaxID=282301 RepID=A0A1I8FGW0_9PLAT